MSSAEDGTTRLAQTNVVVDKVGLEQLQTMVAQHKHLCADILAHRQVCLSAGTCERALVHGSKNYLMN